MIFFDFSELFLQMKIVFFLKWWPWVLKDKIFNLIKHREGFKTLTLEDRRLSSYTNVCIYSNIQISETVKKVQIHSFASIILNYKTLLTKE